MEKKIIIAIHGVGETEKGSILYDLARVLELKKVFIEDVVIEGTDYKELITENGELEIIEINWSDLMKPKKKSLSVVRHVALLFTAMLAMAEYNFCQRLKESEFRYYKSLNPVKLFRWLVEGFMLGAIALPLLASVGAKFDISKPYYDVQNTTRAILMISICCVFGYITFKATKYSKNYKYGWISFVLLVTCATLLMAGGTSNINIYLIKFVNRYRTYLNIATNSIWFLVTIFYFVKYIENTLRSTKVNDNDTILSELSFMYLPYIGINAVGTILTLLYLTFLNPEERWPMQFNLQKVEVGATIVYSIIGLIPLIVLLIYSLKKDKFITVINQLNIKGFIVQQGLKILLLLAPILLFSLNIYLLPVILEHGETPSTLLDIYKISILRLLPYIAWLVGPLAVMTDVMGDILFYMVPLPKAKPENYPGIKLELSIRRECCERTTKALLYASNQADTEILVLAHSWGSVVASDVLYENSFNCKLITLGSPIQSLCKRFLGKEIPLPKHYMPWLNAYRFGDYIAGPIPVDGIKNVMIGSGGHTGYWSLKEVGSLIREQMKI